MESPTTLAKTRAVLTTVAACINVIVSFLVFSLLDIVDVILCFVYRVADLYHESEWKPCYCSGGHGGGGEILVSENGESRVVRLSSKQIHVSDVSDTLYARASVVSDVSKSTLRRLSSAERNSMNVPLDRRREGSVRRSSGCTVNAAVVEMIKGRIIGMKPHPTPRWSDCNCRTCTGWTSSSSKSLYVKTEGANGNFIFPFLKP